MASAAEAAATAAMAWMGGGTEETGEGDGPLMLGDGTGVDADDAEGATAAGQDGGVRTKLFGDADSADGGSRGSGAYSRSSGGGSRRSAGGKSAGSGSAADRDAAGEHEDEEDDGVVVEEGVMDAKASRAAKAKADRDR
jgi:hypothetical protein